MTTPFKKYRFNSKTGCPRIDFFVNSQVIFSLAGLGRVRMNRIMLLGLALIALVGCNLPAEGGLCAPPTVQKESPYHYIASLTEALTYAKSGLDRTAQSRQGSGSVGDFDLFLSLKLAKGDFDCAGSQVSAYATSSNQAIRTSAEGTTLVFTLLAKLQDRSVAEYKALLDSISEGKLKPGTVLERQAELAAAYDEAWKLLIPAVIAGTYAVVEKDQKTGLMSGLALTRAERDEILRNLRVTFGEDVARGLKAGQLPLTAAAAALYQVVGDPQRQLREPR